MKTILEIKILSVGRRKILAMVKKLGESMKLKGGLFKGQFLAGEMTWQLRALAALVEVLSSSPSNHVVAHDQL